MYEPVLSYPKSTLVLAISTLVLAISTNKAAGVLILGQINVDLGENIVDLGGVVDGVQQPHWQLAGRLSKSRLS